MIFFEEGTLECVQAGAGELHFIPKVGGVTAGGVGLTKGAELGAGVLAETLEIFEGEASFNFDVEELLEIRPVLEHGGSEVAIVGEEDKAAGVVVERADGIDAFRKTAKEIAEGFAAFGIGERGDNFGRLVHEEIHVAALGFDHAAGGFDFVLGGIGLGAEFNDDFAVDANLAGENELLGVAARSDARVSDDFLKAFEHGKVISNQLSVIRKNLRWLLEDYTGEGGTGDRQNGDRRIVVAMISALARRLRDAGAPIGMTTNENESMVREKKPSAAKAGLQGKHIRHD
jgi:hypothetical protein